MSHTPEQKAARRTVRPHTIDRRSERADKVPQKVVKPQKLDRK